MSDMPPENNDGDRPGPPYPRLSDPLPTGATRWNDPPQSRPQAPVNGAAFTGPPPPPPPPASTGTDMGIPFTLPPEPSGPPPTLPRQTLSEGPPAPIPSAVRTGDPVRIGLWGSGRSGKTTFVTALPLAGMQGRAGQWMVYGQDDGSVEYLNQNVNRMLAERRFPLASQMIERISWRFHGTPPSGWAARLPRPLRSSSAVDFTLDLHDPPGRKYESGRVDHDAVQLLANANGLVYLIDPIVDEVGQERNFASFFNTLQELTSRMSPSGLVRGRLPHYVAVCVTKLDDERLFHPLVTTTDLVTQEPGGMRLPTVPQERAEEFFNWVCNRLLGGNSGVIREALATFFDRDRIAYFATSAIGFRLNNSQVFDFNNYRNTGIRTDGEPIIVDRARPINVLEPLIYLERRIRAGRR